MVKVRRGKLFVAHRELTTGDAGTLGVLVLEGTDLKDNTIYPVTLSALGGGTVNIEVHFRVGEEAGASLSELSPADMLRYGLITKKSGQEKYTVPEGEED